MSLLSLNIVRTRRVFIPCCLVICAISLASCGDGRRASEKIDVNGLTPLHRAAVANNANEIERLIVEDRANPDTRDLNGNTPLHRAAHAGAFEAAEILLRYRANVHARTFTHWTALHLAVRENQLEMVQLLILWDSNLERRTPQGEPILLRGAVSRLAYA